MGIRAWFSSPSEAEDQAEAAKARERIAHLKKERKSGRHDPDWIAQELRRAHDNLNYALDRGPYKD